MEWIQAFPGGENILKVVASYNIKGGVGKTTSAVNLSYCAANEGLNTLLIDLDPQADGVGADVAATGQAGAALGPTAAGAGAVRRQRHRLRRRWLES